MAKSASEQLRLYTGPSAWAPSQEAVALDSLADLCGSFERATGWPLRLAPGPAPEIDTDMAWSAAIPLGSDGAAAHLRIDLGGPEARDAGPRVDLETASELAAGIAEMAAGWMAARSTVREREADLAAGIPLAPREADEKQLAASLVSVLKGGATAIGCQAAAVYMLDEATTQLKLRAAWGLPFERFLDAPRPLATATADLEALTGHAVVLENPASLEAWNPPEACKAAVCTPVSTAKIPLGTLWVYSQQRRDFSDHEVNLVEIIAGRLASDLERAMLSTEARQCAQLRRALHEADAWQQSQLPLVAPLSEQWDVAGWTLSATGLSGRFHDWIARRDGSLLVALGGGAGSHVAASLTAATVRAAWRSHAVHTADPVEIVSGINETLWAASAGDLRAELCLAALESTAGAMRIVHAGNVRMLRIASGEVQEIGGPTVELGADPSARFAETQLRLEPGDVLLIAGPEVLGECGGRTPLLDRQRLAELSARLRDALARTWADRIRGCEAGEDSAVSTPNASLVVVRRKTAAT